MSISLCSLNYPQYGSLAITNNYYKLINNIIKKCSMLFRDVFPRLNRPVRKANLSEQTNSNLLLNTVPLHMNKESEIKDKTFISLVLQDQLPISLYQYFTSLLSVPMFTETLRKYPIGPFLERKCCRTTNCPTIKGLEQ